MFFSPELLARRDSGIGLLWLAATLGSKSTFKTLQKRNVLTADISQLCALIAEPAEPLALRLSSNLMVGAARVYKVKQEIFMSDVTICSNSLKKMVQEFESRYASDAQLQMAQPNPRPSALTLAADPRIAFAMEFDNLVADWDEYLNIGEKMGLNHNMPVDEEDEEFDPKAKQSKRSKKNQAKSLTVSEDVRGDLYILNENHDHLLSSSFDASFNGASGIDLSSSQYDGIFGFDNDFFNVSDGFDIGGGLGDELAKELGEGWGGSPVKIINNATMDVDPPTDSGENNVEMAMDFDFDLGVDGLVLDNSLGEVPVNLPITPPQNEPRSRTPHIFDSDKENLRPPSVPASIHTPRSAFSPANFSQAFLSQDALQKPECVNAEAQIQKPALRKYKRTRLLLDARTELTDEEMKAARAQYLELQNILRREIGQKRTEKNSSKIMADMLWGIPSGIQAQVLVDFWLENFKVQVEARSGAFHIHMCDEPPTKRRKVRNLHEDENANTPEVPFREADFEMGTDIGMGVEENFYDGGNVDQDPGHLRSSEEPGQARRTSRPPSVLGSNFGSNIGLQDVPGGSQRSSLFPWDNAGASSSVGGTALGLAGEGSDRISIDQVEVRLRGRGSSLSRRGSSLVPSQIGSATGVGFSPMAFGRLSEDNFAFELPVDNVVALESQQSDINLITLERNSFNFLEYAKMQHQTLPMASTLAFDDIVPKLTSTRHVAAAAFYHCLVLATKDLIHLEQKETYGALSITFV